MSMTHSENIVEIAKALSAAQAEMGAAVKNAKHQRFDGDYANINSVIAAIRPAFCAHGLSFTQSPFVRDGGIGVVTLIMHTSGQWISSELIMPAQKMTPQDTGTIITYARRYALQSMAGLPAEDTDAEPRKPAQPATATAAVAFDAVKKINDAATIAELERIGETMRSLEQQMPVADRVKAREAYRQKRTTLSS